MKEDYTKCKFVSSLGYECNTWFPIDGERFCPVHRTIEINDNTDHYINLGNQKMDYCYRLNIPEIQLHIKAVEAKYERAMQDLRIELQACRKVLADKMETLSAEERKQLRKIQSVASQPVASQRSGNGSTPKKTNPSTKVASKLGVSMDQLMEMDFDDIIAKYNKGKDK
jgi:hypothetical protein